MCVRERNYVVNDSLHFSVTVCVYESERENAWVRDRERECVRVR